MTKKICYVVTISSTIRAFFLPQLQALKNEGYEVTVIANDTVGINQYIDDVARFIQLDIPRGISVIGMLRALYKLTVLFKKEQFDYIQYSTPNAAVCASIAATIARCKIRNYHLMGFRYLSESGIKRRFLKMMDVLSCFLSTNIECVSHSNLKIGVSEHVFPAKKAEVIWNGSTGGVDLDKFNIGKRDNYRIEIRNRHGICEKEYVFGFVGRITRDKGVNELLAAFQKIENAKLLMIGDEEGSDTLNSKLYEGSKFNNNIIFTGRVDDVEKYFAAMDCMILPSYREGFGNVVIESEAMGTPVIVSNIPGPIDAVEDGTTALLIEPQNIDELYKAMLKARDGVFRASPYECYSFAKNNFDSKTLAKKVLEKRKELLG